jgi:acetyltransferase-like isoleucine patch superfamily enzyme
MFVVPKITAHATTIDTVRSLLRRIFRSANMAKGNSQAMDLEEPSAAEGVRQSPEWFDEAQRLGDGARIDGQLLEAVLAELRARAAQAGGEDAWTGNSFSDLCVCKKSLPDWWDAKRNLLLAAPDAKVTVAPNMFGQMGSESLIVLGKRTWVGSVIFSGAGGVLAIGDQSTFHAVRFTVSGRSSVLIGERSSATFTANVSAANGGAVIVGREAMWAQGVRIATDDMHSIRDMKTGERVNAFGGRVVIGEHVWLCGEVRVLGNCRIGAGGVVGEGSLVKKGHLPPNSVSVGRPARPVRSGIIWTREDKP